MQRGNYQMFQMSATVANLCPQPRSWSSVINHLINDCLLNAWPIVIQMLPQLINISQGILIGPLYIAPRDSVIYVLKYGMLGSHRLGAIIKVRRLATKLHDGCGCTASWPAVLFKLKLVLCLWLYIQYGI